MTQIKTLCATFLPALNSIVGSIETNPQLVISKENSQFISEARTEAERIFHSLSEKDRLKLCPKLCAKVEARNATEKYSDRQEALYTYELISALGILVLKQ